MLQSTPIDKLIPTSCSGIALQFVTQPACHIALMLSLFRRPFGIATEHASFGANMSAVR